MSDRIRLDDTPPEPEERSPAPPPERREEPPRQETRPEPEAPQPGEEQPEERPVLPPEAQERIDRLTRERYELQRQRDEARVQLEQWARMQQQPQQPQPPATPQAAYEQGRREEQERIVVEHFNRACNDLYSKGRQEYGQEMDDAVQALNAVGWGNRPDALHAVTQLPDAHRVYRELGRDLDRAARILNLPPVPMALELARLAQGNGGGNGHMPVSRAPAPVSRIGGSSRSGERALDDPRVTMAEFIRRRERDERRSRIGR